MDALEVRRQRQRSGRKATLLAAAVATVVALFPFSLAGDMQAVTLPQLKKDKVLFERGGYELRLKPRRTKNAIGKAIPKVLLRKVPPAPVKFAGIGASIDSDIDREMLGFPFTTSNTGSLSVGFPRVQGTLSLSAKDPPISAELDDATKSAEVGYTQDVGGIGSVGIKAKTSGEWAASWNRQVEDIGNVRTTLNSALDWSVDLDTVYPTYKGVSPSVSYGATQDGMRLRAKADSVLAPGVLGSYQVQNLPGKYGPSDLIHDASVTLASGGQSLQAEGKFDRRLSRRPFRGSVSYTARTRPVMMKASVDFDRYRLQAGNNVAQVSAALGHKAASGGTGVLGGKPAELGLRLGPVSAEARLAGSKKPRVRVELAA